MLERLRLVGRSPDVRVGRVGLLLAVPVGQAALGEPLAHLGPAAELVDELRVEPGLVDPQRGVGQQPVAVEPLDVVALEGRAVAPDVDAVLVHRADEQRARDRAAQRGRVEVRPAAGADVERAAGQRGQALLDQLGPAVDDAGQLRAVLQGPGRHPLDVRLVVLADVGGVGARHGALLAHPGHRHRGVQAAGERDADPLALREGGQDLAHLDVLFAVVGRSVRSVRYAVGTPARPGSAGSAGPPACRTSRSASAAPPSGARVITRTVSSPAIVPSTLGQGGVVQGRGQELRRAGRGPQHHEVGRRVGGHEQLGAQPGQPRVEGLLADADPRRAVTALGRQGVDETRRRERTLTAPSSSRSRDRVAWVTSTPSRASSCGQLGLGADGLRARAARRSAGVGRSW